MRMRLIIAALLASFCAPALAQGRAEAPEKRIERLEQELRAVQRKVFPNGPVISPEIGPGQGAAETAGVPATAPIADLTARLDAIEGQLRQLTGMAEQNGNRVRTLETQIGQLRDGVSARLDALEHAAAPPAAAAAEPPPAKPAPVRGKSQRQTASATVPDWVPSSQAASGDAEADYNEGFHLWEQKRYAEAAKVLEGVARTYPEHRYASWAANLAGRAYLDDGKPAAAAKILLANYQSNPRGERAADSLYFLGQALVALKKPADACKAYDELQDVYGAGMRAWLKQQLPAARAQAKCR
jgi:TolA-binding protein